MAKGFKTGGRKKGVPNKITKELRALLKNIMFYEIEKIPTYLENLEPKERLEIVIKIMPYVLPKIENVKQNEGEPISFDFDLE